jgi:hypothetical protein
VARFAIEARSKRQDTSLVLLLSFVARNERPEMPFRFYSQMLSTTSRTVAAGILSLGLMLIGLGVLIAAFPRAFAFIVAGLLVLAGLGCAITAVRIFLSYKQMAKSASFQDEMRSDNIRVRPPDGV